YRGRFETVTPWLFGVGTVLIVLGLVLPKALVLPNRAWMKLAHVLSLITTPIILAIVYFLIVTPIGVVKRMTGWDPLRRRGPDASSYWKPYADRQRDSRHYEKMY
ncbi:MAG TPA: SxtJ family membrane protein, partial [Blastocatellia bacterium]|nr:SxtJ family membrane protein [Blastocatellia bacterium]